MIGRQGTKTRDGDLSLGGIPGCLDSFISVAKQAIRIWDAPNIEKTRQPAPSEPYLPPISSSTEPLRRWSRLRRLHAIIGA